MSKEIGEGREQIRRYIRLTYLIPELLDLGKMAVRPAVKKWSDLTSAPLATKLQSGRSDTELSELVGESKDQIHRYILLTYLIPELLELVDLGKMAVRLAVEKRSNLTSDPVG